MMRQKGIYYFNVISVYGFLSFSFSLLGIFLPFATFAPNPLDAVTIEHVLGHIFWGMIAGSVTFSLRYIFLTGAFAIILDADHIIQFFGIDSVIRMGHSVPFAFLALFVMMFVFGRKNYVLGAIAFGAVFSHMSFDTFIESGNFPIFIPFSNEMVIFQEFDWIFLQIIAICLILSATIVYKYKK